MDLTNRFISGVIYGFALSFDSKPVPLDYTCILNGRIKHSRATYIRIILCRTVYINSNTSFRDKGPSTYY